MAPPSSLVVPMENPKRLSFHRLYPSSKHPHRSLRRLLATVRDRMARYFCNNKFTHRTSTLLKCIKAMVVISMVALGLEWMAIALNGREVVDVANEVWVAVRGSYLAPAVVTATRLCIVLFAFQSMDRIALCLGWVWVKWRRPQPRLQAKGEFFPMVLVQIPMCNEKEVYAKSISSACELDWPSERLLIQVLDDSDDAITCELIREEVESWMERGVNIVYHHRAVRVGYKAGNLAAGMECEYVRQCEFVAIFDADFRPAPNFLKETVPHFKDNPELALVQARWEFVNRDENLLTRLQNINLRFHFEVEQQVNGALLGFFGFNGTAGVWRVRALHDAGGWLDRTTVEDMDIAVRAHLKGWRFVFLNHVKVMCELPESFQAYKKQQHRWHSGPMQLLRLCLPSILTSKISMWKKMNLIFLFFLLRKLILPLYSFILFCVILPLTMFVPEAELPIWVICYIPILMSILNVLPSPSSFPFIIPYLLFENTMSVTKFHAMLSGLLRLRNAYEWVVTKKSGRSSADEDGEELVARKLKRIQRLDSESDVEVYLDREGTNRRQYHLYRKELALAFLLLTACARSLISKQGIHFYYLLFQGLSFLLVGLDLVGEPTG